MIPRSETAVQSGNIETRHDEAPADNRVANWQRVLQDASLSAPALLERLGLSAHKMALADRGGRQFPLRVPPAYLQQIRAGDPHDPLLLQVLPRLAEDTTVTGYGTDPVGDLSAQQQPGLLHKYHGRVLLTLTGACAIHCRYCFRRHFPYAEANPSRQHWEQTLDYLRRDDSVNEVIFSGGDPLSLPDQKLAALAADLATIPHLKRLRIHSRMPAVLPERITPALLDWLTGLSLKPVLVVHINHAREIGPAAADGLRTLHRAGIHLLNQAVLLKGVNDSVAAQRELSETLFAHDVLPYYLHMLDAVDGAAHFNVDDATARNLMTALRCELSGFLVPRLVRETSGTPYKMPLL